MRRPAEPSRSPRRADNDQELYPKFKAKPPQGMKSTPEGKVGDAKEDLPGQFPGERYGSWTHPPHSLGERPRCLHLFSGPQRKGDLADCLSQLGWAVCSVDISQPHRSDLLDVNVREAILEDVERGEFDHVMLGTPCETYSHLRREPPGPRPLRSKEEITGISSGLSEAEKKQLREGNEHTNFSSRVMGKAIEAGTSFTMENPEPIYDVSIWRMPEVEEISKMRGVATVDFDQCRYGCESTKPTRLMYHKVRHSAFDAVRCNHKKKMFKDSSGKEYWAAHERVKHRFRVSADGKKKEYASKALGNYKPEFCRALAEDISKVKSVRAGKAMDLRSKPVP